MKQGILLVNLGTPDSPSVKDVRKYLKQFLSDERVIDLPWLPRNLLLYGLILPFRSFKTSKAYQQIWDQDLGSPLRFLSESYAKHLQAELGDKYLVKLAMRYGQSSIASAVQGMRDKVSQITLIPMYPQFAASTTSSVVEEFFKQIGGQWNIPDISVISQYYDKDWYIQALANRTKPFIDEFKPCHTLMSFHGLPVRQVAKSEKKVCDMSKPCPAVNQDNHFCYRAQCYQTARRLAEELCLTHSDYSVSFQSRLGRIPWIEPYTDQILSSLRKRGIKRLSVVCPSFVTDCLETLEEIGISLREQWLSLGGEALQLVPALNDSTVWVRALAGAIEHQVKTDNNPWMSSIEVT